MTYGWNYGFSYTDFKGMLIAYGIVTAFYITFILCYSELATAIPSSAGPAAYAEKAFGRFWGYLAGLSVVMEYLFAAPAISISVGAYIHMFFPPIPALAASVFFYVLFVFINCRSAELGANVELAVTLIAVLGIVLYCLAEMVHVDPGRLMTSSQPANGASGVLAAVPYAVWFYLAVESGAMDAEECKAPESDMPKAFIASVLTLAVLTVSVLVITAGTASTALITSTDSPLPTVAANIFGLGSPIVRILGGIGLFALIASLQGVMIGYSRQGYTLARNRFLPAPLARLNQRSVPDRALKWISAIGLVCVLIGKVNALVCISTSGSAVMTLLCIFSVFRLRLRQPDLKRPYRVAYPIVPIIALLMDLVVVSGILISILKQGKLIFIVLGIYFIAIVCYFITRARTSSGSSPSAGQDALERKI